MTQALEHAIATLGTEKIDEEADRVEETTTRRNFARVARLWAIGSARAVHGAPQAHTVLSDTEPSPQARASAQRHCDKQTIHENETHDAQLLHRPL